MTEILCKWLNNEVGLSRKIDEANFASEFATGYLIGEVLNANGLQLDFESFSQTRSNESKLNNFTRIEPELRLLDVPFDVNVASEIMNEKPGVSTRVLYQVYIALNNKKKSNLTGVALQTMKPRANANLNYLTSIAYREQLKQAVPRQSDVDIDRKSDHFRLRKVKLEELSFKERFNNYENLKTRQMKMREENQEKIRQVHARTNEMCARIQNASLNIPKPPDQYSIKAVKAKKEARKKLEIEKMQKEIENFEDKIKQTMLPTEEDAGDEVPVEYIQQQQRLEDISNIATQNVKSYSNDEYIGRIKKRLNEDASARDEREKRRRKVLMDQLKSHEAQQEAHNEELLVARLMRQSQQERRIAVQLMQARREKQVIRENRILREKQYEERRNKDFEEAMDMEAEMANLAKIEYAIQIEHNKKIHSQLTAERALARYNKHYDINNDIVQQIVDYACKVAEYRELTNDLIPAKIVREWQAMFVSGVGLYDDFVESLTDVTACQVLEEERQSLLDQGDFEEYKNMMGEWAPAGDADIKNPYRNNRVLGHIIQRLFDIIYPPAPPPPPPKLPEFPIKVAILGKIFGGKSTCIKRLVKEHRLVTINVEQLVSEAIQAHKDGEVRELILPSPSTSTSVQLKDGAGSKDSLRDKSKNNLPNAATTGRQPSVTQAASGDKVGGVIDTKANHNDTAEDQQPINDDSKSKSLDSLTSAEEKKFEPTNRAVLGAKALKCLKKGKTVEDQINIDIIFEAIRVIPDGTGWILDGFPFTYVQAKLLEKALTGQVVSSVEKLSRGKKSRSSTLVSDPRPSKTEAEPMSGINVVIVFDMDDDICMRRCAGRYVGMQTGTPYQMEFNPPPEGSATGVYNQEMVQPVEAITYDNDQIQLRLASFHDGWAKIDKWYSKFGILRHVDATMKQDEIYMHVESILEDAMDRLQCRGKYAPVVEEVPEVVEVVEKIPSPPPPTPPPQEEPPIPEPAKKTASPKKKASAEPSRDKKGSARGRSAKKSLTPELLAEPEEPPGPPPPKPDSEEWEFMNEPIEEELATVLAPHWETIEYTYITSCRFAFRMCRTERENIIRYFYQIKQDFMEYLRRPDHKQQFITQWQKDFNEIADDIRDDDEMRTELHQRVDDMRERLWSICDEKKQRAEYERDAIMGDGWLEDRLGLLNNHYISLIQTELDRFQDSIRLIRDYYAGMEGGPPCENSEDYARLGLIQLSDEADLAPTASTTSLNQSTSPVGDEFQLKDVKSTKESSKSPNRSSVKSRTPSGKKRASSKEKKLSADPDKSPAELTLASSSVIGKRVKIPLLPRTPAPVDTSKDKTKKAKKDDTSASDSPTGMMELDDRLLMDAFHSATGIVDTIINQHQAVRDAEVAEEKRKEAEQTKEMEATTKKSAKKKGKSASPSGKKGKKDAPRANTPPPSADFSSEEEKAARALKAKKREESAFAMEEEEKATKIRIELIRLHALGILQDLRSKAEDVHKAMFDWLGTRFLKEMESIDQVSEVIRHCIEESKQLKEQIVLMQEDFTVNEDRSMVKLGTSPSQIFPTETPGGETFTVVQIQRMLQQFLEVAPSGVMSTKSFCDTFENMISVSHGMQVLPEVWMSVSSVQVQDIGTCLGGELEYVDWRRFLLALLYPIPTPTQQELLDTLEAFRQMDQRLTGFVTREQFNLMPLWFTCIPPFVIPTDNGILGPYDRLGNLRKLLFDIFGNLNTQPPVLDYVSLLLYFSATHLAEIGLMRALSVAAGEHMPHMFKPTTTTSTLIHVESSIDLEVQTTLESILTEEVPAGAIDARVPLNALYRVLHHGEKNNGDSHRFSLTGNPEDSKSQERLSHVYNELNCDTDYSLPYRVLLEHPLLQDVMASCYIYKLLNLKLILSPSDNFDNGSIRTIE